MYLYLLTQNENKKYDTYDSCVVCARSEKEAKMIDPTGNEFKENNRHSCWAYTKEGIQCELIGILLTDVPKVVIASYNAG